MAARTTFSGASTPPLSGIAFLNEYSARLKMLFDTSSEHLTSVGGTANAVTATLDPVLDSGGLVDGMKFSILWAATNTGAVTLSVNGGTPLPVVDKQGVAFVASAVVAGLMSTLIYVGGVFYATSELLSSAGTSTANYSYVLTTSGTFNKPSGPAADRLVLIEAWGGGGTAGTGGGGGGGFCMRKLFRYGDIPASVGYAIAAANGNTTFGALLTAFGGSPGGNTPGGSPAAGASGGPGGGVFGASGMGSGLPGTVGAAGTASTAGGAAGPGGFGSMEGSGGGAGSGGGKGLGNGAGSVGGDAMYGGAGGGGWTNGGGAGGNSQFGGDGGTANGGAGQAPGGGGSAPSGAGARGEIRIFI